jgi:glycosyltransferase involved in cell wall biosynthesis
MDEAAPPLATIAIPTFNRAERLKQAVASACAQDYPSVEILIVDNASEDVTKEVCQALADEDPRIRYMRQPRNVGPTRNFETGLENARGHYFMWLSDDDWITPNYVRRCAEELEQGHHIIVVGHDYWNLGDHVVAEPIVTAMEPEPTLRMLNYLKVVGSNAAMSGLSRTEDLRGQLPIPRGVAADWLWLLAMLSKGTLAVLDDAHLYRDRGGVSSDFHEMAVQLGSGKFASRFPRTLSSINVFTAIARGQGFPYPPGGSTRRYFAVKAGLVTAFKVNPLDDLTELVKLALKRLMPTKGYEALRISYQPIRRIQRHVRARILSIRHRPAGRD